MTITIARALQLFVVFVGMATAGTPIVVAQTSSKSVVAVDAAGPAAPVAPGETFTATLNLKIRSGYHINAQKPSEDYLIGTSATVTAPKGFTLVRTTYPKTKMASFSFSETPLAVYDGNAMIALTLKADPSATAGTVTISAKVEFQACNDDQCLPPSTVDVSFSVDVTDVGTAAPGEKQTLTVSGAPPDARIFVDGKSVGVANPQGRAVIRDVAVGRRLVRVEAAGFAPFEKEVEVTADAPATLAATLAPGTISNANAVVNANDARLTFTPAPVTAVNTNASAPPTSGSQSSWLLWVLGGVIVAALAGIGVVAATRGR